MDIKHLLILMVVCGTVQSIQWQRLIRQHTNQLPSSAGRHDNHVMRDATHMRELKQQLLEEGRKMAAGHVVSRGSRPCPCTNPEWCKLIQHVPDKEVFVFSVDESNWQHYDWSRITTIATFFRVKFNYPDEFMCHAHSQGARHVLTVDYPKDQLTNVTARQLWVKGVVDGMIYHFADGINVDFEADIHPEEVTARDALTSLMKELTKAVKAVSPNTQVSFDYPGGPYHGRTYDYKAISDIIDFAFLMDYDEIGDVSYATANIAYGKLKRGIEAYMALGIPAHNMLMGLPWYGYWFSCSTYDSTSTKCKRTDLGQMDYSTIMDMYNKYSLGHTMWDDISKTPYLNLKDPITGRVTQIWYDDPRSLKVKFDLIETYNLRGAGNWQCDCLDYKNATQVAAIWGAFPKYKTLSKY